MIDPDNPVVRLCAEGMQAESEGRVDEARRLFEQAWADQRDDFDACIAAHFVARAQREPIDALSWNREALRRAERVPEERVRPFRASLLLNLGFSLETTGEMTEARRHYERARDALEHVPDGPYGDVVRDGVTRALGRVS